MVKFSICIPAYNNNLFLRRVLESVEKQTFQSYEVIVGLDFPSADLVEVCLDFQKRIPLIFYKNEPRLGTPKNWNFIASKAKGEFIYVLHYDDWLVSSTILEKFVETSKAYPEADFIFGQYFMTGSSSKLIVPTSKEIKLLYNCPEIIYHRNFIGPPSSNIIRNSIFEEYDERMKWLVDIEFYVRILKKSTFAYISEPVVHFNLSEEQVTSLVIDDSELMRYEHFLYFNKHGMEQLKKLVNFDAFWRFLRNNKVQKNQVATLQNSLERDFAKSVISNLNLVRTLVHFGFISKFFMLLSYLFNYTKILNLKRTKLF